MVPIHHAPQPPQAAVAAPVPVSGEWKPDPKRILADVVPMLDDATRRHFRSLVQKLKHQRDTGVIPSLSDALLREGPSVVGERIWRECVERQRPKPRKQDNSLAEAKQRQEAETRRLKHRDQLQRELLETGGVDDAGPAAPEDLLATGDLFDAPPDAPAAPQRKPKKSGRASRHADWRTADVADEDTCRRRLARAAARVDLALVDDGPDAAEPACELLSRATQVFLRDACEALVTHSRRRRNEEARRVASQPGCGLRLRWLDRDVDAHAAASARRARKDGLLLDAMVDHDLLTAPPVAAGAPPPASTWATAKRLRAAEIEASGRRDFDNGGLDHLADTFEFGTKRVKREETDAEKRSRTEPRLPEAPDEITEADVHHHIRSERKFESLLF